MFVLSIVPLRHRRRAQTNHLDIETIDSLARAINGKSHDHACPHHVSDVWKMFDSAFPHWIYQIGTVASFWSVMTSA